MVLNRVRQLFGSCDVFKKTWSSCLRWTSFSTVR